MAEKKTVTEIPLELREGLAKIVAHPGYKSFEKLCAVRERQIILGSFAVSAEDKDLATKTAWYKGRIYEIKKLLKLFESLRKDQDDG